jgi:hypothetical protein
MRAYVWSVQQARPGERMTTGAKLMNASDIFEPKGLRFYDLNSGRRMLLVDDEERADIAGWIAYKHPDGKWVSLRKATDADLKAINDARILRCQTRLP